MAYLPSTKDANDTLINMVFDFPLAANFVQSKDKQLLVNILATRESQFINTDTQSSFRMSLHDD